MELSGTNSTLGVLAMAALLTFFSEAEHKLNPDGLD